jgi:ABC-type multidrug transport system permease subunit
MSTPETKQVRFHRGSRRDFRVYMLAALAGIVTGLADITVDDLLFTALIALASCMALGMLRPARPWRWVVAMAVFIPLTEFAGYLVGIAQSTRAQIYGSFLAALPGIAGAYGGSVVRGVVENLRQGK